jgi:iron complex outermembrane receptor protein
MVQKLGVMAAVAGLSLVSSAAFAQRAGDNALTSADDAFGTSVGNESIGLYDPSSVRGFSPIQAGNVRLDGLYFDRQADLPSSLTTSSAIRVGIAAQGYPLPAPTGIADFELVRAGEKRILSVVAVAGPFAGGSAEVDLQQPIGSGRVSVAAGVSAGRSAYGDGSHEDVVNFSVAPRWRPNSSIEVIPFFGWQRNTGTQIAPVYFADGDAFPPHVKRGHFYGQPWAVQHSTETNFGVLTSTALPHAIDLRAGVFRSEYEVPLGFSDLLTDLDAAGVGDHLIVADHNLSFAATSGEIRLGRTFGSGRLTQRIYLAARARSEVRRYGGSDVLDLGQTSNLAPSVSPALTLNFGPQTFDHISQQTLATAYEGRWDGVAELSLGLQKTHYRKTVVEPDAPQPLEGRDSPWLYNAAVAVHVGPRLVFYASYATGLEEGGVAPANAINEYAAPPAIHTKQWDAGLRYAPTPELKLLAGVFDVRKPYYSVDEAKVFRLLGQERHTGIELSLTGRVAPGLTIVVGSVLLNPRVSGEEVASGRIGPKAVGQSDRYTSASIQYQLPRLPRVSIDTSINSSGWRTASSDNRLRIPPRTLMDVGGRYRFQIRGAPATLRLSISNIFNNYGWVTGSSGVLQPNIQRRASLTLSADF